MRRSILAFALLLAAAPVAGASEIFPDAKPALRAVEVEAPAIRKHVQVAPARAEARSTTVASARQMDRESWTIVLIAAAVIAVTLLFF